MKYLAVENVPKIFDCVSFETMRLLKIETDFTFDKNFKEQGFICIPR